MKKFYAILMAVLMCTTASFAQKALPKAKSLKPRSGKVERPTGKNVKDFKFLTLGEQQGNALSNMPKLAPKKLSYDPTTLITEAPAGKTLVYAKYGPFYYSYWGYIIDSENTGTVAQMVWGDDGCLYYLNPLSGIATNTYLKLEKESDDTYVAHLPQAVYYQEGDEYYQELTAYAAVLKDSTYEEDGETYYTYVAAAEQDFRIKIDGDTLRFADPEVAIGMVNEEGEWYGYADWNQRLTEFKEETVAVPEGLDEAALDFALTYNDQTLTDEDGNYVSRTGYKVKCAMDAQSGKVYAKGIFSEMPDAWICGTYDGKKAVFPSGQYMGVYSDAYFLYFYAATTEPTVNDEGEEVEEYVLADDITFDVDLSTMTMTTDRHLLLNAAKDRVYYAQALYEPELTLYTKSNAAPADPTFTSYSEYDDSYGYGYIRVYMPALDVDGKIMDTDALYYNLYSDEDVVTLYQDDYTYQEEEEMTDIPYNYYDSWDIYRSGALRTIYYYFTGFDKIGVQLVHKTDEGLKGSAVVYYNPAENTVTKDPEGGVNGIESISLNDASVKNVSYTDLSGRAISRPNKGIYIKTVTLSDGSQKSSKVIK